MMKMLMRLDKTQVNPIIKAVGPASGIFKRDLYLMAGYKQYALALVGGGGGRSGRSTLNTNNIAFESGGGGGGSLFESGDLIDLDRLVLYSAGPLGAAGADKTGGAYGENGADGQPSSFGGLQAYGGQGGRGGRVYTAGGGTGVSHGRGGDGGDNSILTGIGGGGANSQSQAQAGTGIYDSLQKSGSGGGGGGGRARIKIGGDTIQPGNSTAGATGANTPTLSSAGQPAPDISQGGNGGGANVELVLGTAEYYGCSRDGSNGNGVVLIKVS